MAVVTSLTLTEAETAVHLPAPPSPSPATVAVAGQTINVSVDNSRCDHYSVAALPTIAFACFFFHGFMRTRAD